MKQLKVWTESRSTWRVTQWSDRGNAESGLGVDVVHYGYGEESSPLFAIFVTNLKPTYLPTGLQLRFR